MDRERAKEYIKDQLEDYLKRKGINTNKPFNCLNPSHPDKHPSMSYDKQRKKVKCFSCGVDYDTLDLIGIDYGLTNPADIFARAYELYGIELDSSTRHSSRSTPKQDFASKPEPAPDSYRDYLIKARERVGETLYFKGRGLSQTIIDRFSLGYDPAFKTKEGEQYKTWKAAIIPNGPNSYTIRNTDPDASDRYRNRGPSQLYNRAALWSDQPVFVVEGELDALSLEEVGAAAVALGSTSNTGLLIEALEGKEPAAGLILSLDNDQKGQEAAAKIAQKLTALQIPFIQANIAGDHKDPSEALTANRAQLMQDIQAAQNALSQQLNAEQEKAREEYLKTSAAHHLQDFINGITASVNTPYIPTGFNNLDSILDGGLYEGLYILGAITSLGKTSFALQMADQIAQGGQDVLIFSLEMARTELMAKSISRLTFLNCEGKPNNAKTTRGITTGKWYDTRYSPEEKELIGCSMNKYEEYASRIFISEGMGEIGADQIRETVKRHKAFTNNSPVVLVDYLQLLAPADPRSTDKQNTDKAVLELKRISRDYKIPVIAISSFNRVNYSTPVSFEAFKESGAIEYSSDVLIGLQLQGVGQGGKGKNSNNNFDVDEAKKRDPRNIELKILKNRNGRTGDALYYDYYPKFNYFEETDGGLEWDAPI